MPSRGPPRRGITATQRIELRQYARIHPRLRQAQLAAWFTDKYHPITQATVSESLSSKYKELEEKELGQYTASLQKARVQRWPDLEEALLQWHIRVEKDVPISDALLKTKAEWFWSRLQPYQGMAVPQFSNGWLLGFKKRHGIRQRIRHGEAASIDEVDLQQQLIAVQAIASQFHPSDIYNCDETGLFWKATPDRSLATQNFSGTKKLKNRITAHFCCNADGSDKLPIWFIGHTAKPRAFGAANINLNALNCLWRNNGTAWMTGVLFAEWLHWFDNKMAGRKVLLLMDNFSGHKSGLDLLQSPLQNVQYIWLPPNTTSRCQPLDQGIIKAFKAYYKRRWLQYMCTEYDDGKNPLQTINVLKAIRWSIEAWDHVTTQTISNCWFHSTLIPRPLVSLEVLAPPDLTEHVRLIRELQRQQRIQEIMSIESFLNPEEEIIADHNDANLDEEIACQFDLLADEQTDEEIDIRPRITTIQALEWLQGLQEYEEQQEDGQSTFVRQLNSHKPLLQARLDRSMVQQSITAYF